MSFFCDFCASLWLKNISEKSLTNQHWDKTGALSLPPTNTDPHITMKTHIPRIISVLAIAGAFFFVSGCATPAGEKAKEGQQGVDQVTEGVNSGADTVNRAADTVDKVSKTVNRLFK